jgi:hypothetical protein
MRLEILYFAQKWNGPKSAFMLPERSRKHLLDVERAISDRYTVIGDQ